MASLKRRIPGLAGALADRLKTTVHEAQRDDLPGEAAKIAYFFLLSLFPAVLIIFALTGIVGGDAAFTYITDAAKAFVPASAWQFVQDLIREITDRERPGVLSLGIVITLWGASNGIAALTMALNKVYDVREGRGWWRRRGLALLILVVGAVLLVLGAAAFVPSVAWLGGTWFMPLWNVLRWALAFVLVASAIWLAYYMLPARNQRGALRETAIGAVVATTGWALATGAFGLYVNNFARYGRMYGAIGAIIVLMIWFYITALAVLAGGELAAVLEQRQARRVDYGPAALPDVSD
jgi:membrane protein